MVTMHLYFLSWFDWLVGFNLCEKFLSEVGGDGSGW